ncbi:MAG: hypothetical protein J3R72DRAFT_434544 [Linnemannia gamsii]|nr:MAG: hypothetical protein J3R72DRAFT_434544 [Linnemannia gamsii]
MFEVDNFISFHDLSPNGTFIWTSPSVTAILGYEHEEIEGVPAYEIMHKDDIAYCRITHQENVLNDMVGTQIVVRFKHKDGSYVPCMVIFSVCYDYIVTCSTVIDTAQEAFRKVYTHSAAMTSIVGSRHKEFERIKRHHKAFGVNTWNPNTLDPEPRACMILNRFSRNLGIMYASPSCQLIFKIDPDKAIGKPLLIFLRADDLAGFVEQAELAKSSNVVTHMRFWFQSPNCREEIPCEAMMFGAADGLVAVLRRCRPFMRRQAITGSIPASMPVQESPPHFVGPRCTCGDNSCRGDTAPVANSNSSNKSHPYLRNDSRNDSGRRSHGSNGHHYSNHNHNNNHNNHTHNSQSHQRHQQPVHIFDEAHRPVSAAGNHPNVMNGFTTNPRFSEFPTSSYSSVSSSESSSLNYSSSSLSTSSYSPSPGGGGVGYAHHSSSNFRPTWFSTKTIKSPLQGIPIGSINSIRNLDKDQQRLRPLRSLQDDSLDIVDINTQLPPSYRLRTHHTQENGLEETELDLMMSKLDTYDDDDDDNSEGSIDDGDDGDVEEVIDCRDSNGHMGVGRSSGGGQIIEMDTEMEDTVRMNGSRIRELESDLSASASPTSVKARRRQESEDGAEADGGHHHRLDGSPVPQLQVGPSVQ